MNQYTYSITCDIYSQETRNSINREFNGFVKAPTFGEAKGKARSIATKKAIIFGEYSNIEYKEIRRI